MTNACGFIALVGAPNAGKSTLVNQLVGDKVSIVSPKVQTTRTIVRGIISTPKAQLVFIDTPGLFQPKKKLEHTIVDNALMGLADADIVAVIVDAKQGLNTNVERVLEHVKLVQKPKLLILNKIDTVTPEILLPLSQELNKRDDFKSTFMVSALKNKGVDDIIKDLEKRAPEGPWMYPENQSRDSSFHFFCAEITREQLFLQLQQELPYSITVITDNIEAESDDPIAPLTIHQTIFTHKENQKAIILGKRGARIKQIGTKARHYLEHALKKKIHLYLHVKVKPDWENRAEFLMQ